LKFGDNDTLSAKVAGLVDASHLVILSDIDGMYSADPTSDSNATLLETVNEITPELEAAAGGSGSCVGTGGMKSKIDAVKIAMASGIPTFIGKASKRNIVIDAVEGKAKGTYFKRKTTVNKLNQKKKWIAFHSGIEGDIVINQLAKEILVKKRQSLSATGIHQVIGKFEKGAVIRVNDCTGKEIGLGIVNYSAEELRQFLGKEAKTAINPEFAIKKENFVCHLEAPIIVGI
jgi:glutamate 5-kinase